MEHELQDLLGDAKIVVVVEWGEVVKHILPERRLKIEISQTSNDGRELVISAHPSLEYLLEQS
jgi:tRNA A37 threonylcarbamoyladenosine biosynthesis protein TsaE